MVGMPRHMVMLATEEKESPGRLGLLLSFPSEYASLALCINRSASIRRIPWATENSWKQGFLARLSWKM